jgi:hypothetical protein
MLMRIDIDIAETMDRPRDGRVQAVASNISSSLLFSSEAADLTRRRAGV